MKAMKKLIGLLLVLTMTVSMLAACGKKDEPTTSNDNQTSQTDTDTEVKKEDTATPEPTAEPEVVRDLGGITVQWANWWYTGPEEITSQYQEDTQAYRQEIQDKYNFTWEEINIGGWGEFKEIMITSTVTGDPAGDIFVMDQSFVAQPLQQGLLYDLSTLESFDFTEEKWSPMIMDLMSKGDGIYGMKAGRLEPRLGIFFNKRLFEEAGIDPEEPYDLQASGQWTWDKFKEYAQKCTRDTNNDGTPDTYGLASFSCDFFRGCVFSNGGEFIGKDENGLYVNKTSDPRVLEALQFGRSFYDEGYHMTAPEGSNWDWFIPAFQTSQVAMTAAEQYKVTNWAEMEDDWGFVLFPAGPQGTACTVFAENIMVMPAGLDPAFADSVAFAYNLWTEETPGWEDQETWQNDYYAKFRDARAVDETLAMMYEDGRGFISYLPLIPDVSYGDIAYGLDAGSATPAETIEKVASSWQILLDDANGIAQ